MVKKSVKVTGHPYLADGVYRMESFHAKLTVRAGYGEIIERKIMNIWDETERKKVLFLSFKDYAGSGVKFSEALNLSNKYQSRFIAFAPANFGAKNDIVTTDSEEIQAYISQADIIHLKGDEPLDLFKYDFGGKKIFQTVGGSRFRAMKDGLIREVALESFDRERYNNVTLTGITPDLCGVDSWMPHAIEVGKNVWKKKAKPIVCHSPSDRLKKGSNVIIEACQRLGVELKLIELVSVDECIKMKAESNILIDQIVCDAYGMNAVEAMAMGIPVISACEEIDGCPVYRVTDKSVEGVMELIQEAIKTNTVATSKKFHEYAKRVHSCEAIKTKLEMLYD